MSKLSAEVMAVEQDRDAWRDRCRDVEAQLSAVTTRSLRLERTIGLLREQHRASHAQLVDWLAQGRAMLSDAIEADRTPLAAERQAAREAVREDLADGRATSADIGRALRSIAGEGVGEGAAAG